MNTQHYNILCFLTGHSCEIKKRFHAPSTAMSMPSLIICENNASDDASKDRSSASGNLKQNIKKSSPGTGAQFSKKVVTESVSAPLVNCETSVKQQSFQAWKKSDRRNKKNEKAADEITKEIGCQETNLHAAVMKSHDQKGDSENKERMCDKPLIESILVHERTKDIKSETLENIQDEECSLKNFLESNNLVCNHRCDPAIPEISETSDAEDDENKEKDIPKSEPNISAVPGAVEGETVDLDQQADPEVR